MREFDLRSLIEALHEADVEFVVIGDLGVIRRGGNVTAMTRFGGLNLENLPES